MALLHERPSADITGVLRRIKVVPRWTHDDTKQALLRHYNFRQSYLCNNTAWTFRSTPKDAGHSLLAVSTALGATYEQWLWASVYCLNFGQLLLLCTPFHLRSKLVGWQYAFCATKEISSFRCLSRSLGGTLTVTGHARLAYQTTTTTRVRRGGGGAWHKARRQCCCRPCDAR